jgi:hypothetical protein
MITRRGRSVYFYAYAREGARVRRVYAASGEAALEAQEAIDEARRLLREQRERALEAERQHAEALAPLAQLSALIDQLVREALQARGFRLHARGAWRMARR